jgi:hypothetical protein
MAPTYRSALVAVNVKFSEQDINLANNLADNSTSKVAIILKAGIDIYSEVLRLRDENKSRETLYLKFVEGNRLPEDSDRYLSLDLNNEFPTKLLPETLHIASYQDIFLTEENNILVQRLAQSSGVDASTVLKAGLYLYAAIIQARKQGCTLGITEGNKVIHRITLKPLENEDKV